MARVVGEVRPKYVFVENSPMLVTRGLERVLGDLTSLGYDTKWTVMGAADVGANHKRDRIWLVGKLADTSKLFGNGGNDNARVSLERKAESKLGNDCWEKDVGKSKRKGLEGQWSQPRQQEVTKSRHSGSLANTPNQGDVWRQWKLGFAEQEHHNRRGSTDGSRKWWEA